MFVTLSRTAVAVVVAVGLLFVGTAVAQDQPPDNPMLPYATQEECEANGGAWRLDFCVDPVTVQERSSGQAAPEAPAPAESVPAQPRYTG